MACFCIFSFSLLPLVQFPPLVASLVSPSVASLAPPPPPLPPFFLLVSCIVFLLVLLSLHLLFQSSDPVTVRGCNVMAPPFLGLFS